jgi:hypothetical protein
MDMRICRFVFFAFAVGAVLSFAALASAATITGEVYTNFCGGLSSNNPGSGLGTYSGSCSSGNSTFTVSGDAEGSGLTFGDTITAIDSNIDPGAYGTYGYAATLYDDEITFSASGVPSFTFDVDGTTSNVNGGCASYQIIGGIDGLGEFDDEAGTCAGGSGVVTLKDSDGLLAGTYGVSFSFYATVCIYNCATNGVVGERETVTSDYLDTFQLVGAADSGGGTIIGADGTNFTALSSVPEPGSFVIGLGGVLGILGRLWFTARRSSLPTGWLKDARSGKRKAEKRWYARPLAIPDTFATRQAALFTGLPAMKQKLPFTGTKTS